MITGKRRYLKRLTTNMHFRSADLGEKLAGATPPSIFIGAWNYPKVNVGPLIPPRHGDTSPMDTPEGWLGTSLYNIVDFRLNLVRGKYVVGVKEKSNTVQTLQEIALAKRSFGIEAEFAKKPRGNSFSEWHQPFGPSAPLKGVEFDTQNIRWEKNLEKAYYDTDLLAREAVQTLHSKGLFVSTLQRALSVGAFGIGKNRRLVPTRWSITAVDSLLADFYVEELKNYETIDSYMLFEGEAMNTYFIILLTPTAWKYEMIEAFIHILGREEIIFSDYEITDKKDYSKIGGCYYSGRLAVAEKLCGMKKQAGALVFRESRPGYIPLGVWLVREAMRKALEQQPLRFSAMDDALKYIETRMQLPFYRYRLESTLLKQRTVRDFTRV